MPSSFSNTDLEYMFWAGIRNGSIGTIGTQGPPGGFTAATDLTTADLNTIITPGLYRQSNGTNVTLVRNYPTAGSAGALEVIQAIGLDSVLQRYTPSSGSSNNSGKLFYIRRYHGATWGSWYTYSSTRVDQTAGRAIYQWDDLNMREQLIYGDTGWRDISADLINGWTASGGILIRRIGYSVTLIVSGLSGGTGDFLQLPTGFFNTISTALSRPLLHPADTSGLIRRTSITSSGVWQNSTGVTTGILYGDASYNVTSSWPTSLPGSAIGTIPNL